MISPGRHSDSWAGIQFAGPRYRLLAGITTTGRHMISRRGLHDIPAPPQPGWASPISAHPGYISPRPPLQRCARPTLLHQPPPLLYLDYMLPRPGYFDVLPRPSPRHQALYLGRSPQLLVPSLGTPLLRLGNSQEEIRTMTKPRATRTGGRTDRDVPCPSLGRARHGYGTECCTIVMQGQ